MKEKKKIRLLFHIELRHFIYLKYKELISNN